MFYSFVTKHVCDRQRDNRTVRQNYDPQDHASTAASCGKKTEDKKTYTNVFTNNFRVLSHQHTLTQR